MKNYIFYVIYFIFVISVIVYDVWNQRKLNFDESKCVEKSNNLCELVE